MEYKKLQRKNLAEIMRNNSMRGVYLFNADRFIRNFTDLQNEFRQIYPNTSIGYSYKTNWMPEIGSIVHTLGGYAEVTSPMEKDIARKAVGVSGREVIYNGIIPDISMLEVARFNGKVNIESVDALRFFLNSAEKVDIKDLEVGIRIRYEDSRFGMNEVEALGAAKKLGREGHKLAGIHCHVGGSRSLDTWKKKTQYVLRIAEKLEKELGYPLKYIDLGGHMYGRMVPELAAQFGEIPTFKDYAEIVGAEMNNYAESRGTMPELILEPGTALIADAVTVLARIENVKEIRDGLVATLSVSSYDCGMIADYKDLPIENITRDANHAKTTICGYTCMEEDFISRNAHIYPCIGDIVHIQNCGAYSLSMKGNFIYEPLPVLKVNDRYEVTGMAKYTTKLRDIIANYTTGGVKCLN